jgi:beta-barrel assembly-enhancing protease
MFRRPLLSLIMMVLSAAAVCAARKPGEPLKPGFNLFSKQQDMELGQQAAQQVRQQYEVVQNQELQDYIRRVGEKLAATPEAHGSGFPFSFTLLNQTEVNAFALPGGPTFVFSGLIKLSDNEGELAGVLAHEISHVILRHGTHQASKANLIQMPALLAGSVVGGGATGQLVNLGLGVGLNGLFLKYSRDDESQADALGTRIMSEAGYNPIEMANMFEKLQAQGGPGVPQFLSSHPNPGNRVTAVQAEIQALPQRPYDAGTGQFQRQKQLVTQLPQPAKPKQNPPQ